MLVTLLKPENTVLDRGSRSDRPHYCVTTHILADLDL